MYSAEQRAKVIVTFARFGCSTADTTAKLGYPSRVTLHNWWKAVSYTHLTLPTTAYV